MENTKQTESYWERSNKIWHMFVGVSGAQEKVSGAEETMAENLFNVMKNSDLYLFKKPNEP